MLALFFFNGARPTAIYTLSLHDALPICADRRQEADEVSPPPVLRPSRLEGVAEEVERDVLIRPRPVVILAVNNPDRKSTRLNFSHLGITYDGFRLKQRLRLAPAMDEASS